MGRGLESRCVGSVCGVDVAVHGTIRCISTSNAHDDGRMHPKHVELRIHQ